MAYMGKSAGVKGLCRRYRSRPDRAHADPDRWRQFHYLLFHHGEYDPPLVAPEQVSCAEVVAAASYVAPFRRRVRHSFPGNQSGLAAL